MADLSQMSDAELTAAYRAAQPSPLASMSDDELKAAYQKAVPVTATDRIHAAEGGVLGGTAYLAALPFDTVANAYNLGKAGLGAAYQAATGKPGWDVGDPSPVGQWLTQQMDKNPVTSTQPPRPDDAASRYLSAGASVVPGLAAGGGSIGTLTKGLLTAAPAAIGAQVIADKQPFSGDTANRTASILTQALAPLAARAPGALLPENTIRNNAVTAGQEAGYKFPIATTNPTSANRALEGLVGKQNVQQYSAVKNQDVSNQAARAMLQGKDNDPAIIRTMPKGAIDQGEIIDAKKAAAPGYDALRTAGNIQVPATYAASIDAALSRNSGASRVTGGALADPALEKIATGLKKGSTFDASDAVDAISVLRDKSNEAFKTGNTGTSKAYKALSNNIEDAIEQHLQSQGGPSADILKNYRASRQQFAKIASLEEARNGVTGNVVATQLTNALKNGDPLTGNLAMMGNAAGQAPLAFKEPTHSSGVNHLGFWGGLASAGVLAHEMLPTSMEHMAVGPVLTAAGYQGAKTGAKAYILGPGQKNALPRGPGQLDPGAVLGSLTSALSRPVGP